MCGPVRVPCRGEALDSNWTIFPKPKSRLYSVTAYRSALVSHEGGSIFARLLSSDSTLKRPPCLAKNKIRCWSSGLNCVTPSRSNGTSSTGRNRTHDNLLSLEGKEDGARALYLQGYYSVFLRKSTPAA